LGISVSLVAAVIILSIFARLENWKRDLTTNHAKLTQDARDPLLRPLLLPRSADHVANQVQQWAGSQSQWAVESTDENDQTIKIHLTRTTGIMRFTDDIHVELIRAGAQTRVEAASQSRIGKADFGQNPRNLKELVQALQVLGK
jgi:uncharacterized protein (DUF1499 family)